MQTKVCSKCGEKKRLDDFVAERRNKDGRSGTCRKCHTARCAEWARRNPDRARELRLRSEGKRRLRPIVEVAEKRCSKCGVTKAIDSFHKRPGAKDGRRSECKQCQRPRMIEAGRRYAALNPEKRAASWARWYARNKEQVSMRYAVYARENADLLREKRLARYRSDPKKYRLKSLEWAKQNRPKINERMREWIKTRPDVRERRDAASRLATKRGIDTLSDAYVKAVLVGGTVGLSRKVVPRSLIEAKRVQLQIKRLIKEKTK